MYYGGAQKRPDGNYSAVIRDAEGKQFAEVGQSNRKDVRNAVEAAVKGQQGWEKKTGYNRAQILYYIAENLELRADELAGRLAEVTGRGAEDAKEEVGAAVGRLFYWASYADKYGGCVQETQLYGTVVRLHEPVGRFLNSKPLTKKY